ncbi:unnamed protein product [Rhizophagus irregularis]|nr:unnamed protein product [Rhizophagus irregularis]
MTHEYQIVEVKNTVYPDANPQSSYENFDTYQDNQEMRQEPEELYNWDDVDRVPMNTHKLPPSRSLIMQISPDTSFSQDGPANVLSSQHVPFPTSEVLQPRRPQTVSQPIDFHKELNSLTSTQELIHGQLGSILTKLDGISPPISDTEPVPVNHTNSTPDGQQSGVPPFPIPFFHISPSTHSHNLSSSNILRLGSLNVRSLVNPTKQLNLFSILLSHALHGIILTETNLCSPAHRYVCNPYLNSYNFSSWFTHSPVTNRHSGVGLMLQLPGKRNILIIGGYVPPVSSSNRSVIADCYSTLIS